MIRGSTTVIACVSVLTAAGAGDQYGGGSLVGTPQSEVLANENRSPAGTLRGGVLTVALVAAEANWSPEGADGPGHDVYVFGEEGGAPQNPGPLLRVTSGTEIRLTLRNSIAGAPLVVHGLHDRPGPADTLHVPSGETRTVQFRVTEPGTYFYWGSTRGARLLPERWGAESQLVGALIVDPPGGSAADHVFVIGIEDDSAAAPPSRPLRAAVVNGRSWPHSQQLTVHQGDTVRMRWINSSDRFHPMHLHGFHFRVDRRGTIVHDSVYDVDQRRTAVTELLAPGQTMAITWVPERAGNWIMHCHMTEHISPALRLASAPEHEHEHARGRNHALEVMSGLVIGWRVLPRKGGHDAAAVVPPASEPRRIRLLVQAAPGRYGGEPGLGFVIQDGAEPAADSVAIPGPPLVLTRGEPVAITVLNRLNEPTSIHWHGMELDSYFDGVSGWSGDAGRISPEIAPGDSFDVHFTPPRSGTFIYHSHFHEERQLASGMYGPLLVLDSGARYDPETDRTWILSQSGPGHGPAEVRLMLNGSRTPVLELEARKRYRIRVISISPNAPVILSVLMDSVPVHWRAIAKDGADLPASQANRRPAVLGIGVGETYDFELTPERAGEAELKVTGILGIPLLSGIMRVRPPANIEPDIDGL